MDKEIIDFYRTRLDRHIDTNNLTDKQVIELAMNGEYIPYTSRDLDTALHNLSNMKDLKKANPEWYQALTVILTAMKKMTSDFEGWEDDVYYF